MLSALLFATLLSQTAPVAGNASLLGIVVDAATQQPIAGARVWLVDLQKATTTNAEGRFTFEFLPAGSFTITVSNIGYIFVKRLVHIPPATALTITIALAEGQGTYQESVTVVAASPERPSEPGVASQTTLGSGGLQSLRSVAVDDPMRAIQSLPGVAAGDDFRSEFSVRGASFRQMGIVIDDVATPMLMHTVKGADDTGSVAMINTDILDSASLFAGAHPQRDGNWLGGTLRFTVREGSRDRTQVRLAVSDTGAAAVIEGPLGRGKRASWLLSARKSYADWLIRKLDPTFGSTLGFYDVQSKLTFDISSRQQLQFLMIGGDANYFQNNSGATNGLHTSSAQSLVGSLAWRYTRPRVQLSQRVSNAYSDFDNHGLVQQHLGSGVTRTFVARTDVRWLISPSMAFEAGGQGEHNYDQRTLNQYTAIGGGNVRLRNRFAFLGERNLSSAWAQITAKSTRGAIVGGVRGITDNIRATPHAAPWLLAELKLGSRVEVKAGVARPVQYGDVYQLVPPTFTSFTASGASTVSLGETRVTRPERALAYDLGIDVRFGKTMVLRVNGYTRDESDILRVYDTEPRLTATGSLFQPTTPVQGRQSALNSLAGQSRGVEFLAQRRAQTGLVGWISYTYARTDYQDAITGENFPGDFDQRHTANIFLEERWSYRTAFSLKVRLSSSPPIPGYFSGTIDNLFISGTRNQVRLPKYGRIDARANRTFTFNQRRLTLFLEMINATNRKNYGVAGGFVSTSTAGHRASSYTEKLIGWLPSIGILIEF
jgi:hypothetical protein